MTAFVGNRILMLLENSRYPQDPRVRREATALTQAGFEVTVIAPASLGTPRCELLDGVRVYRFPMFGRAQGFLGYLWEYSYCMTASFLVSLWIFVRHGFDVVHAHNPPDMFVFIAAFYKLFGKKFVFDHHDLSPEMYFARFGGRGNRFVYRVLVWLEIFSCRFADHVIATNESYKAVEMERGKVPPQRITVVRNGPELKRFIRVAPDEELRRKAPTILCFAGAMGFQDGLDYLLRALKRLICDLKREDFFCVLIGGGDAHQSIKNLADELALNRHVWFTGYIPDADLIKLLSTADICLLPDPSNPFTDRSTMIKMMEYMAMSKPVVAFDLPEHRITGGEAAVYATASDELDFARKIALLMDDSDLRNAMGEMGREQIESRLAWKYQAVRLVALYHDIFGGVTQGASGLPRASTTFVGDVSPEQPRASD